MSNVVVWENGKKVVRPSDIDLERAAMQCSQAQMRLALNAADLLDTVETIAAQDAEAAIVWEYATVIYRNSPFIDALGAGTFTEDQIDDLFRAAMAIEL